jgi:CsoR family transcriptional regulator, copper-sensing transcriptional repressor
MDENKKVIHRLKIARGHLNKVIEMVERGEYCVDILVQSKAVRSALSESDKILLEHHLSHCVVDHIKQGNSKQAVDEVMKIFNKKI